MADFDDLRLCQSARGVRIQTLRTEFLITDTEVRSRFFFPVPERVARKL